MLPAKQANVVLQPLRVNLTAFRGILEVGRTQHRILRVFSPPGKRHHLEVLLVFGGSAHSECFCISNKGIAINRRLSQNICGIATLLQHDRFQPYFSERTRQDCIGCLGKQFFLGRIVGNTFRDNTDLSERMDKIHI